MDFEIEYQVRYAFSAPVRLGRYTFRLRPISDANQDLDLWLVWKSSQ